MKVQKKVLFLAIFLILSVSLYACKEDNPSLSQEDIEMVNPEKEDGEKTQEEFTEKEEKGEEKEGEVWRLKCY